MTVSIFDKLRKQPVCIDFQRFVEIVEVSCMGFELIEMIRSDFEPGVERQSIYFQTQSALYPQVQKHEKIIGQIAEVLNLH